jgi:hypothetical protein
VPKLKEIDLNYEQIKDLFLQLDFEKKMALMNEVIKDKRYRDNFYAYTERLAKKYRIPAMSEEDLDGFLHSKN